MEIFRTPVIIKESQNKITYHTKVLFLGSCFTENIGNKLEFLKFQVDINPFGIIYNPESVGNSLEVLMEKGLFNKEDLGYNNNQWYSFYHHSRFSNVDAERCLEKINQGIEFSNNFLKECDFLFITFGTSWVYRLKESQLVVSNCHKIPASEFEHSLLKTSEIIDKYNKVLNKLFTFNPKLKIIFTVSPIRYWKDGAVGNQLSKSTLIMVINELIKGFTNIDYFPAYEIMMDDLRDYRFYAEDMIHPNQVAINYIWNRFSDTYIARDCMNNISELEKLLLAKNHKVFEEKTAIYRDFLKSALDKIIVFSNKYPFINLDSEIEYFKTKLLIL
jgi:hypothetical protein